MEWIKFNFMDREVLKNLDDEPLRVVEEEHTIMACSASRGQIMLGTSHGYATIMDRSHKLSSFPAHDNQVLNIGRARHGDILVTVGLDDDDTRATIKLWKIFQHHQYTLVQTIKPFNKLDESPIMAVSYLDDLSQFALGLGSGALLLIEGDLLRGRFSRKLVIGSGPCITGLHFQSDPDSRDSWLYVTTISTVSTYFLKDSSNIRMQPLDSFQGCQINCSVLTSKQGMLAVAMPQLVMFFQKDDLGSSYGFDRSKKLISWFGNYLVVVNDDHRGGKCILRIYDLSNQFVAYTGNFPEITHVVSEWGALFVFTASGNTYRLQELDLNRKIETLFKKNSYDIAISLARTQNVDESHLAEIFKEYGDHLYNKGDFDRSIVQYLETIKDNMTYIEPSYIIRKFLDGQRIENLTSYLEALHSHGCANKDHTTLLLNCFTKSKDVRKLGDFIKRSASAKNPSDAPSFDIETAIRVCRQAGYYSHAKDLARQHMKHEWYLKILLEDLTEFKLALEYISSLSVGNATKFFVQYGKVLIREAGEDTTELLKALCTDTRGGLFQGIDPVDAEDPFGLLSPTPVSFIPRAEEFFHIFVGRSELLESFLEHVINQSSQSDSSNFNTLLELYLLNRCNLLDDGSKDDQYSIKILSLLSSKISMYNPENALVLSKLYRFEPGVLFLYKKLKLFNEILLHYMERSQYPHILEICTQYESEHPDLWIQALVYFSLRTSECPSEIEAVLDKIDALNLLPPLIVVRMLSKNPETPLRIVKKYLLRKLQDESDLIMADEREIQKYQDQTEKLRSEIKELRTTARTFNQNRCFHCRGVLEIPAVHFLCLKHSYHSRCLDDYETRCPECDPEYRQVVQIKSSMNDSLVDHEVFFKLLQLRGFSAIAEYFGRGILYSPSNAPNH